MTTITFSLPMWVIYLALIVCLLGFLLYTSKLICNLIKIYINHKRNKLLKNMPISSVDCRWNRQVILCANSKIKRTLFGFGRRLCIQHNSPDTICPYISSWPKVALIRRAPVKSKPVLKNVDGLELYCHACKRLIEDPGALLFSPPKGIAVEKYHFCRRCYSIIISSIETGGLYFGNNKEE